MKHLLRVLSDRVPIIRSRTVLCLATTQDRVSKAVGERVRILLMSIGKWPSVLDKVITIERDALADYL